MSYPAELKYTESHEWVRLEGDVATIGISWFAQDSMGDVVHVEPVEVGAEVDKGTPVCEIESVKAVSDVYSPVTGDVVAVNDGLDDAPEALNDDPYGAGWLFKVQVSDASEVDAMLDASAYQAHCEA
jgi:glycine cleavage system H protein